RIQKTKFTMALQNEFDFDINPMELTGERLRDAGIQIAKDHADAKNESWSETVYKMFLIFIQRSEPFMAEDFRAFCDEHKMPPPPSLRAYGHIIVRAAKEKLIVQVGYGKTSNPKAHKTPANIWKRK